MGIVRGEGLDEGTRAGLGYLIAGRLVLAALSLGLAVAIDRVEGGVEDSGIWGVYWTVVAAFLATIVSARLVYRTSDPGGFAKLQVGVDVAIVTALVYFSGGGDSFFTFLYAVVVLYGALFLDRDGVALSCLLAAGGYGVVLFGGELGLLPVGGGPSNSRPMPLLAAYWVFFAGALVVLGVLANTLSAELRRTGAALARRTSDLHALRDLHLRTVESIGSGLVTTDDGGRVTSFNPEAVRITGIPVDEAAGRPLEVLIPGANEIVSGARQASGGRGAPRRDRVEYCNARGEQLHLGIAASRLFGAEGEWLGHVVIFQDVTAVVAMEQELRRTERLAAVGEMAARIAHEIRNPLASISGSVQVLRAGPANAGSDPEHAPLMDIVVREVDRLNSLISNFLRYSRPAAARLERLDLGVLLNEIAEIARSQAEDGAPEIRLEVAEGVEVIGDQDQLKAVVWNLWNNAIEAMEETVRAGVLNVRLRRVEEPPGRSGSHPQATGMADRNDGMEPAGSDPRSCASALLEIADTGPGLSREVQERIFEPFFTTKKQGTGLGLATVQRLIEQHGGAIAVSNEAGGGACFQITLALAPTETV